MDCSRIENPAFAQVMKKGGEARVREFLDRNPVSRADLDQALLVAALEAKKGLVALLLSKGARVDAPDRALWTPLMRSAAFDKSGDCVKAFLDAGARVDAENDYGRTALIEAAHAGNLSAVGHLLAAGADPDHMPRKVGGPALVEAALNDNPECVALLLRAGASPDVRGKRDKTALMDMAGRGRARAVRELLASGADVNARGEYGSTALLEAVRNGQEEVAGILIAAGADVRAKENSGSSVFTAAAGNPETTPGLMELLLSRGADINERDAQGRDAQSLAAMARNPALIELLEKRSSRSDREAAEMRTDALYSAVISRSIPTIEKVLRLPHTNLNRGIKKTGATPLMAAADQGFAEGVALLLSRGAEADIPDKTGKTALACAAEHGYLPIMEALAKAGADPGRADARGVTPLMRAAGAWDYRSRQDLIPAISWLLEKKADPEARDLQGRTALFYAVAENRPAHVAFLLSRGASVNAADEEGRTPLVVAAMDGDRDERYFAPESIRQDRMEQTITALIQAGADPAPGKTPYEALAFAAALRGPDVLALIADAASGAGPEGFSRALLSGARRKPGVIRYLLGKGANPNHRSLHGWTPLMLAAYQWRDGARTMASLLAAGAGINATNKDGSTALMLAARTDQPEHVAYLLKKGADPGITDRMDRSALDYARDNTMGGRILALLEKAGPKAIQRHKGKVMKPSRRFYLTDVFGSGKYSGNQLCTIIDCEGLSDAEMQKIAREINFSETTFVLSSEEKDGAWPARIFTPGNEVEFAGHPTLGTAFVIAKRIMAADVPEIVLSVPAGRIPVAFPPGGNPDAPLWMSQIPPSFGEPLEKAPLAAILGLSESDLDGSLPLQEVSTGLPFAIIPLKSPDALKKARVNRDLYFARAEKAWAKGLLLFAPGGYEPGQKLSVRVFVDYFGVPEDPATGSGNGCLAAYLCRHRFFGTDKVDTVAGQGYEIGRPSTLFLRAEEKDGGIAVQVGGRVHPVAQGLWG
ncbi:MAG: PhzF family phenazine biosynthesis isomerase [Thermodesulfobacteriota bacterium]